MKKRNPPLFALASQGPQLPVSLSLPGKAVSSTSDSVREVMGHTSTDRLISGISFSWLATQPPLERFSGIHRECSEPSR